MMHPDFQRFVLPVIYALLIAGSAECLLKMARIIIRAVANNRL